ncbi:MAG TPA: hypothetical protein VK797_17250, partial [Tepidisphaeraceae bacterium]|nr:hypothetical protein [Tepidisphaeraceae bacterium]
MKRVREIIRRMEQGATEAVGLFAALVTDCSSGTTEQRYVTETEIELISRARDVMTANGYPLKGRIYQVRRDNDGWTVEVD